MISTTAFCLLLFLLAFSATVNIGSQIQKKRRRSQYVAALDSYGKSQCTDDPKVVSRALRRLSAGEKKTVSYLFSLQRVERLDQEILAVAKTSTALRDIWGVA